MAKKVTRFEADDGTLFNTAKEADDHSEARRRSKGLSTAVENIVVYGSVDHITLFEALQDKDNELTQAVLNMHK